MRHWSPYHARHKEEWRAQRFERADGRWPGSKAFVEKFGSWKTAIEADERSPGSGAMKWGEVRDRQRTVPPHSGAVRRPCPHSACQPADARVGAHRRAG